MSITHASRERKPPLVLVPVEDLRTLARLVERLGTSGRTDPEQVVLAKLSVAHELRRLAAGRRP
jgi:hypothetical protein